MKDAFILRLDALSLRARSALACTCIEHVIDLYRNGEFAYPISSAPKKLRKQAKAKDGVDDALALAWRFAKDGTLDAAHHEALRDFIGYYPPNLTKDDDYDELSGASWVVSACRHLLNVLVEPAPMSVLKATNCCEWSLADGLKCIEEFRKTKREQRRAAIRVYSDPEAQWQEQVLERVEHLGESSFSPEAFADLLAIELPWRRFIPEYRMIKQGK